MSDLFIGVGSLLWLLIIGIIGYQAWEWFNLGVWTTISPATLAENPYAPSTQYLGFNQIIEWFWHSHINYSILAANFALYVLGYILIVLE